MFSLSLRLLIAPALVLALLFGGIYAFDASTASAGSMMHTKTGDLNGDGVANSVDALLVLFYDAGLSAPAADQMEAWTVQADVDCDLVVTSLDAALILQADAGLYDLRA